MTFDELKKEYNDMFFDIPFENSQIQNIALVTAKEYSHARKYRALGLRMRAKMNAVSHLYFQKRREAVKVERLKNIIETSDDKYEVELSKIDIEEIEASREDTKKLLNDALVEIETVMNAAKKLGSFDRISFEQQEAYHFSKIHGENVGGQLQMIQEENRIIGQPEIMRNILLLESELKFTSKSVR